MGAADQVLQLTSLLVFPIIQRDDVTCQILTWTIHFSLLSALAWANTLPPFYSYDEWEGPSV